MEERAEKTPGGTSGRGRRRTWRLPNGVRRMDKWADGWMDGEDPEDGEQGVEMEGDFEIRLGAQTGAQARKWGTPV